MADREKIHVSLRDGTTCFTGGIWVEDTPQITCRCPLWNSGHSHLLTIPAILFQYSKVRWDLIFSVWFYFLNSICLKKFEVLAVKRKEKKTNPVMHSFEVNQVTFSLLLKSLFQFSGKSLPFKFSVISFLVKKFQTL